MTEQRLFEVAAVAALIAEVTGDHKYNVKRAISSAMQSDALRVYSSHGRPIYWMSPEDIQRVDIHEALDALNYHSEMRAKILAERDKPVQADAVAPVIGGDKKQGSPAAWQEQARTIADELDSLDERVGAMDSITNMGNRVATKMRECGISGLHGPVTGATVKREALQGGKWIRPREKQTGETGEAKKQHSSPNR